MTVTSRSATSVVAWTDLSILDVRCPGVACHPDGEEVGGFEVVLPVAGAFRRRTASGDALIDAGVAYAGAPGRAQRIEHVTPGDRCLALLVSERLAAEVGLERACTTPWLRRSSRVDAAVARARSHDDETWIAVLDELVHGVRAPATTSRAATDRRRAVDVVREAIAAAPAAPWTLRSLADLAGYAPHHLSRVFSETTGISVLEHRDRVRLCSALAMVAGGSRIADAAAALGFADHGHLARRCRRVLGIVPSAAR